MITTVDFLRHGEASGGSYYRGSTDDPLTSLGWQQMNKAVADQYWDQIISSPLHRCLDFSQELSKQTKIPLTIESNWQEICFGDWEGKTAEQINPEELTRFYQNPIDNVPKNGESYLVFETRIKQAWENITHNHPGKKLLIITHAGVIRAIFKILLKLPIESIFKFQIDHSGLTRFHCFLDKNENYVTLIFHNKLTKGMENK